MMLMQETVGNLGGLVSSKMEAKKMAKAMNLFDQRNRLFQDRRYSRFKKGLSSLDRNAPPSIPIRESPAITLIVHKQVDGKLEKCTTTLNHVLNESFFCHYDTLSQISRGERSPTHSLDRSSGCVAYYKNFMDLNLPGTGYFDGDTLNDCYPLSYRDTSCGISASDFSLTIAPPCPNNGLYKSLNGVDSEPRGFYDKEKSFVDTPEPVQEPNAEHTEQALAGQLQFHLETPSPVHETKALYPESSELHRGASVWKPSSFVAPKKRANKFLQARSALSPLLEGFNLGEISLLVALMFRDERTFALYDYYTLLDSCMFFDETWQTKQQYAGGSEQSYTVLKRRKTPAVNDGQDHKLLSEKDVFWGRSLILLDFAVAARLKSQGTFFSLQNSVAEFLRNAELTMPDNKLIRSFKAMIRGDSCNLDPYKWISAGRHLEPIQRKNRSMFLVH